MMRKIKMILALLLVAPLLWANAKTPDEIAFEQAAAKAKAHSIMYLVASDNCGVDGQQPQHIQGQSYSFAGDFDEKTRTVAFGQQVIYRYQGLNPTASYTMRLLFLSDGARQQEISINDKSYGKINLFGNQPLSVNIIVNAGDYNNGILDLNIKSISGPNAVISAIELYSTDPQLGPLTMLNYKTSIDATITFEATNRSNQQPVAGVTIQASTADQSIKTQTQSDGKAVLQLPHHWQMLNPTLNQIKLTAHKEDFKMETEIDFIEVFGTRISPTPTITTGVKNPVFSLDGTWQFSTTVPENLAMMTSPTSQFKKIEVPGQWVMQGFYVEKDTPAAYFRTFELPADFTGKRIKLHCDSINGLAHIYINGQLAGIHDGGFVAFELDITEKLKPGKNIIAMSILNDSIADVLGSASFYATHPLGGITRKIYLKALPNINIANLRINTTFDENYRDAILTVETMLANEIGSDSPITLRASLMNRADSAPLLSQTITDIKVKDLASQTINIKVPAPRQWNPENPNLYYVKCELFADGQLSQTVIQRFGFRQVEIQGQEILVNGQPIKLRGVNRHEVNPLQGRTLTAWDWQRDAELYKKANCNLIRTSHYPPAQEFLDHCDEIGLFVLSESAINWVEHHANTNWSKGWNYLDRKYYPYFLRANLEHIAFCYNHPSIIIWSLANESRWSPLWADVLEQVQNFDSSRTISFHDQCVGTFNNANSQAPLANLHYPGRGFSPERVANVKRPLFFGEYCHLNSYNRRELETDPGIRDAWGQGFRDMWDHMYHTPGIVGGAIWSGIDDTFYLPAGTRIHHRCDRMNVDEIFDLPDGHIVGYGSWGPIDGWRREKPEFHHIRKAYSPIRLLNRQPEIKNNIIQVAIDNRHDFTNVSELLINWQIGNRKGSVNGNIAPRTQGVIEIPLLSGEHLDLTFTNKWGHRIDEFRLDLLQPQKPVIANARPLKINPTNATISSAGLSVAPPVLMVLPLNSEGSLQMIPGYKPFEPFTDTCKDWQITSITGSDIITVKAVSQEAQGHYTISIKDNIAEFSYDFEIKKNVNPRQWGLVFSLPIDYARRLSWQRQGLWTTYPSDHIARLYGTTPIFTDDSRVPSTGPSTRPAKPWSQDNSNLGAFDFCSTKENIYYASLGPDTNSGFTVYANADNAVRCWYDNDSVKMLIAGYTNAGTEAFFRSHAAKFDRPLKTGDHIKGSFKIVIK